MSNETFVKEAQGESADTSVQQDDEVVDDVIGDGKIEKDPDAQPRDIPSRRQHEHREKPQELDPRVHQYKEGDGPRG